MTTPSGFMKDNRNFLKSGFSLKNKTIFYRTKVNYENNIKFYSSKIFPSKLFFLFTYFDYILTFRTIKHLSLLLYNVYDSKKKIDVRNVFSMDYMGGSYPFITWDYLMC